MENIHIQNKDGRWRKIEHVKASVRHLQSKRQSFWHTLFQLKDASAWADDVNYYNFKLPHRSLNIDDCETPFQAFVRKMHPSKKTKFINQHIQLIEKFSPQFLTLSKKDAKEVVST